MSVNQFYVDLLAKKEELEDKTEVIDNELNKMNKQWIKVQKKFDNKEYSEDEYEEIKTKFISKVNKLSELKKKISINIEKINARISSMKNLEFELIEGDKISISRTCENMNKYNYDIKLKGTDVVVGNVEYRIKKDDLHVGWTGNIGYRVGQDFRGNGYATEALELLINKLKEDNISHVYIALKRDNIASMRVAQKNGGKLVEEFSDNNYCLYKCDLKINRIKK